MRDYQRDPLQRPASDVPARPAGEHIHEAPDRSVAPGLHPGLDTASVMQLQRTAGNQGVVQLLAGEEERSPVHDVVGSGGSPLDAGTRSSMESAFGASFEGVRVHTDDRASKSAESVGANAYTVGADMVFRSGQYDPGSAAGQRKIAHELSHVVQQSAGPVDGSDAPGGIRVSDPGDRFEQAADRQASDVMASVGSGAGSGSAAAASSSAGGAVQREEESSPSMPAIQREPVPEEEENPPT